MSGGAVPSLAALQQEITPVAKKRLEAPVLAFAAPQAHAAGSMTLLIAPFLRHNGSYTSWSANNLLVAAEATILLSTADAAKLAVVDGDKVTVSASGASVTLPVVVQQAVPAGLSIVPSHFSSSGITALMSKLAASMTVTIAKV